MKKRVVVLFIIYCLIFTYLFLPEKKFSYFENRFLTSFTAPTSESLLDTSWMDQFETALTDQFHFRDAAVTIKTLIDRITGKKDNGRVYFGKDGYLMEMEEDHTDQLMANLNFLNALSDQTTVPIDFIPVYHALAILSEKAPTGVKSHQLEMMEIIQSSLQQNIQVIDLYEIFRNSSEECYYHSDHHWTTMGAYLAYQTYIEAIGQVSQSYDLNCVTDQFLGTLHYQAPTFFSYRDSIYAAEDVKVHIQDDLGHEWHSYYQPRWLTKTDQYAYFLDGNHGRLEIETTADNDLKLLIIKDSFANCLIPFLQDHFKYITVIDPRYTQIDLASELAQSYDRCLILYEIDHFAEDEHLQKQVKS